VKKPAPAQQILAEQGYIILAAAVSYPLGSMIPLADCGPDRSIAKLGMQVW
jgi:hypothetical protein